MTCATLPAPAHELLGLLTTTARRRKHGLVVLTSPSDWSTALGWEPEVTRNWRDDLIDWGYLHQADGRLLLHVSCTCQVLPTQNLSEDETQSSLPQGSSLELQAQSLETGKGAGLRISARAAEHTSTRTAFVKSNLDSSWFEGSDRPRRASRLDRPVESWSNFDLGCYWNRALGEAATGRKSKLPLGSFPSASVLAKAFASWRRERPDVTPVVVRAMIDRFVSRLDQASTHQPLWKSFIGQRASLLDAIEQNAKRDLPRDMASLLAADEEDDEVRPTIEQMLAEQEA